MIEDILWYHHIGFDAPIQQEITRNFGFLKINLFCASHDQTSGKFLQEYTMNFTDHTFCACNLRQVPQRDLEPLNVSINAENDKYKNRFLYFMHILSIQ